MMHMAGDFFGLPYDYKSVMHYDQYQQSRNGKVTIQTLDPNMQKVRLDLCYNVKPRKRIAVSPTPKTNLENPLSGYWAVERDQ